MVVSTVAIALDAGIVGDAPDAPEALGRQSDRGFAIVQAGDRADKRGDGAADLARGFFQCRGIAIKQNEGPALRRQSLATARPMPIAAPVTRTVLTASFTDVLLPLPNM